MSTRTLRAFSILMIREGVISIPITNEQLSLLIKEGYIASTSIGYGLTALTKAGLHAQGEYYQAFFQLTIGLERLMKLIIIQYFRGKNNMFPNNRIMRGYGHNLLQLYNTILEFDTNINTEPDESICLRILSFLSEFAMSTRYYNLDFLTGKQQTKNPLFEWTEIQNEIFEKHFHESQTKRKVSKEIVSFLNDNSYVLVFNVENELVKDAKELFEKTEKIQRIQGYSVYYVYRIINRLVEVLENTEYQYKLYPYLREFFVLFHGGLSKKEILKKKKWV